jgi:hypothetical protein
MKRECSTKIFSLSYLHVIRISKQSKRASLLFNDVFAALSSPSQSINSSSSQPECLENRREKEVLFTPVMVDTKAKDGLGSGPNLKAVANPKAHNIQLRPDPWLSLLDDDELHDCPSSSMLQPQVIKSNLQTVDTEAKKQEEEDNVDDEAWNW